MKNLIRHLLWKLTGRDCIVLNPGWVPITRTEKHMLAGEQAEAGKRWLPVSANYHFPPDWRLDYTVHGSAAGILCFTLGVPGGGHFLEARMPVKLPFRWVVRLDAGALSGNGAPLPLAPGATIPGDARWLVAGFEFQPEAGGAPMVRHKGHRLRVPARGVDRDYFEAGVYEDYEKQAAEFPGRILQTVEQYRPLSGSLLDIGCATGLMVKEALSRGLDASGVDVSAWAVEKANAATGGRCRVLDMDQAGAADFPARYDIVIMHSVIEHLADPAKALQLLFNIMQPGGVVYIQTLHAGSLMSRMLGNDWAGFTDYTHKSLWLTTDWLANAAAEAGFECLATDNRGVWDENLHDEVLMAFKSLIKISPADVLLQEGFGDEMEVILRKPITNR